MPTFDFALMLAIFESELYKAVLGTSGSATQNALFATVRATVTGAMLTSLQEIAQHEAAHVTTLMANGAQNALGLNAASFDFTGGRGGDNGGPFRKAASDRPALLQLLQMVEDVGVRAYNGQTSSLLGQPALETVLRIHSAEARHAARIRRLRRLVAAAPAEVRLSGTIRGGERTAAGPADPGTADFAAIKALLDKVYGAGSDPSSSPSEANVTQLGVDVSTMPAAPFGVDAAQEAFDEPLSRADVVAILQGFFIPAIS